MSNQFFTVDAKQLESDTNQVYAKRVWNGKYYDHWLRFAASGPDAPHLLNPWGLNFREGIDDSAVDRHMGKRRYEYRKVSPPVFEVYLKFLKTHNEAYYREAERLVD